MSFDIRAWFETQVKEKNADWANKVIRSIRMNWQPLISQEEAERGMSYLLGCQDMSFIKALFQDTSRMNLTNENKGSGLVNGFGQPIRPSTESDKAFLREMAALDFKPLPIMEKLRNVLISEMKKMGIVVNVRSEDPTSVSKRVHDRALVEKRKELEGLLSYVYTSVGDQPYSMTNHKARFGEDLGNGNIQQFEAMGMNGGDPTDVNFFFEHFHKFFEEIAAEMVINNQMTYNLVIQEFEKWVNDIIAKKCLAATCYVSDVNGAITYSYLAPETVYIYGPDNRQDFNGANAKGYERKVTIREMLDIVGNKFDFETNWNQLLQSITTTSNIEFTGVKPSSWKAFLSGSQNLTGKEGKLYTYNDFMSFKVTLGYIEFSSQNQESFTDISKGKGDTPNYQPTEKYQSAPRFQTPLYKSYYLAITSFDQVLFDFGLLPYNDILGAADVTVRGTIITYKETGDPIAIMAAPLLDIMNEAWFKFRYELRRAKPRGRGWNYDAMVSTLMDLIPDTNISPFNKLQKVMEMLDSSANEIWTFPIGPDGKPVQVPGNQLNYDIPNGISKETMQWWEIIVGVGEYLAGMIGISDLRQGDAGSPRDSMNNQFKALEYSQAATYYVPDMLTIVLQQLAIKTNFYAQDIITYKSHNTMAYKFLEDALGTETLDKLERLGNTALHRFGIFVESINQAPMRQKLEAMLFEAVKNKTISTAEQFLISDIKSTKKAYLTFAYFEQRNKRIAEKAAQALQQQQNEAAQQLKQMDVQMKQMELQTKLAEAQIQANAIINAHLINQQGGLAKTNVKVAADKEQVYHEAQADLLKQQQLLNATGKTTAMPAPPMPQSPTPEMGMGGGLPPEQSAAQQLRENAEPAPTEASMM